ncbi:MAG: hypothetical protein PVJ01_01875 [Pseudomonadota bacterium]
MLVIAISAGFTGTSYAFVIPEGWRIPSKSEYMNENREASGGSYLLVLGDFNDDGVGDQARLCVTEDGKKMGIIVWISRDQKFDVVILDQSETLLNRMGIRLVKAGEYKTACGKGYRACDPDEPEILTLKTDAIDYFTFESANSFFYWDFKGSLFKRIWISD